MRRLIVFNQVTLDGYFSGLNGDLSWAHPDSQDAEWKAFVEENAGSGGALLLGRVTYELMASYWPTPLAASQDPVLAHRMNNLPKIVFSKTLGQVTWSHTRLVAVDLVGEVRQMKQEPGKDIAILGSGSLVAQLTPAGLIDEYQMVVNPVVLGQGRTMFDGIRERLNLKLTKMRTFGNGNVLLCYEPVT
jgi:dihydrofolate reductase